ncbi:hypothetical protein VTK73DRAFT_1188 [Phialemonium thermophilum]|uniref:Subtilase family protein n=1 Tax=Phialemonium thermophilum TaxID=223376 RepID=A0ABR3VTS2_9PEZI
MASRLLLLLGALVPLLLLASASPSPKRGAPYLGLPIANPHAKGAIADRYIVVYNSSFDDAAVEAHQSRIQSKVARRNLGRRSLSGRSMSRSVDVFRMGSWRAMALDADERTVNEIFAADEVAYIEQDARVSIDALASQSGAPSGLVRISHARPPPANGNGNGGNAGYVFDTTAGEGVTAFVVDTGIRVTHSEFQGRATFAANFVNDVVGSSRPTGFPDLSVAEAEGHEREAGGAQVFFPRDRFC